MCIVIWSFFYKNQAYFIFFRKKNYYTDNLSKFVYFLEV